MSLTCPHQASLSPPSKSHQETAVDNSPSYVSPSDYFFFCLAFMLVMFNVDLLYIIVMLMLPDGLESCRAHSHHVSIITVINFMQVLLQARWIPE